MSNSSTSAPKLTKIARYEILRELGRGGMATVYLAHDPNFQRDVAVKVLPREAMHDSTLYHRFQREARTIASLEHPAIVPVHDFGESEGQPFLVMRYLSGGSLASRIKQGPLPVGEAAKVLLRIGGALDAAHAKGIVHRDLKPANILFDQYGDAYLSDFGIAQLSESTSPLTGSAIIGTPAYMSPEQIRGGEKVDGRADIYALGIVLFEMLTGKTPFKADTPAQLMMAHLANPTPRLPEDKSDLPDTINGVLIRAMAKDPDLRFQKASEIGNLLAAIAAGETPVLPDASQQTYGLLKETSATRVDAEGGGPRRPARAAMRGGAEEAPAKISRKWPIVAAAVAAVVCVCAIAGTVAGYAAYKNPDALSSIFSPKGTATVAVSPTEKIFAGLNPTPEKTTGVTANTPAVSNSNPPEPTMDTSGLVGEKFEISLNEEISDGVPAPGAGNIENPGAKDIYTFSVEPGQIVYFQLIKFDIKDTIHWRALDDTGTVIFKTCFGCGDPGNQTLEKGGTYTLIVGDDNSPAMGTYKFKLWGVTPPQEFTVAIGDTISKGVPSEGAGMIETPGAKDIYTFTAEAGQIVYFQLVEDKVGTMGTLTHWRVVDERGYEVFASCFGCGDPGSKKLSKGGTYVMTVGDDTQPGMGTYKLRLWNVPPPDSFSVAIGQEISDGVPGPGAGNIESPGAKDVYTFTAKAGQTVYFQLVEYHIEGNVLTHWKVVDERGYEVFATCFGCGDPGNKTLDYGGTYTMTVGDDTQPGMGTYKIKFWNINSTNLFQPQPTHPDTGLLFSRPPDADSDEKEEV
jgi:serine/threonine protein kinase